MDNKASISCPSAEELIEHLNNPQNILLEEHFYLCDQCTEKARQYMDALAGMEILKASFWKKRLNNKHFCMDTVIIPAANSSINNNILEIASVDNQYLLRLLPIMDDNKSVLEVRTFDAKMKGTLIIENSTGIIFRSPINAGIACDEINNNVDLKQILIYIEN